MVTDKERKQVSEMMIPDKLWFSLREACELKNLNYKTSCNRKNLQPNGGMPDGNIGGRKMWLRSSIEEWILKTDDEIERGTTYGQK